MRPSALLARCAIALAAFSAPAWAATREQIVELPSANASTQPYLLSTSDDERAPAAIAVLFNGGEGVVGLQRNGIPHPGRNFLVRSRALFVERGVVSALIDVPSDVASMSDRYRMSERHAADVSAVVADLQVRWPKVPVFLVGTSRGTVSAAHVGSSLGTQIAGVVLTSTVFDSSKGGAGLSGFDYARITVPLLFVHHVSDTCFVTPYWQAKKLGERYPLVSVSGGDPPRSDPCEAMSAHGYLGREAETVDVIVRWMLGQNIPRSIP